MLELEKLTKLFLLAVAAVLVISVIAVDPLAEPVRAHHKPGHGVGGSGGGGGADEATWRVRVDPNIDSSVQADRWDTCDADTDFDYWHMQSDGPHDSACVDPSNQRMQSAILAGADFYFDTFGRQKPHNPGDSNDVQRWVVMDFLPGECPDLDTDLYQPSVCDGNSVCQQSLPTIDPTVCHDNVEIYFQAPAPFSVLEPTEDNNFTVDNFDIEIMAPRVKRNGSMFWVTEYMLEYNSMTVSKTGIPNQVTMTSPGAATLRNVRDGSTVAFSVPLSWTLKRVFGDQDSCCQESPPGS